MDDVKKIALQIAEKYKFEPYKGSATAINDGAASSELSRCANHLDEKFMSSLENSEFLDSKYLSK